MLLAVGGPDLQAVYPRSDFTPNLRRSATEAQLGMGFKVELELPIFHSNPDLSFRVRGRIFAGQFSFQNELRNVPKMSSEMIPK